MAIDQEIEPGQLYRETDTDRAFKVMDVSETMDQAKIIYIEGIDDERVVDTRGTAKFKPLDVMRRRLAEGSLVRITDGPRGPSV